MSHPGEITHKLMREKTIHSTISWKPVSYSSLLWWAKQRRQAALPLIYHSAVIPFQNTNYFPILLLLRRGATLAMNFIVPAYLFMLTTSLWWCMKNIVPFLLNISWNTASFIQYNKKKRMAYPQILAISLHLCTYWTHCESWWENIYELICRCNFEQIRPITCLF